jgi:hypothetical protein
MQDKQTTPIIDRDALVTAIRNRFPNAAVTWETINRE